MLKWVDKLPEDVCNRLGNCCSRKSDIPILVNARWSAMVEAALDANGFTKEDALIEVLDLLDCNDQFFDLTKEEYRCFCSM